LCEFGCASSSKPINRGDRPDTRPKHDEDDAAQNVKKLEVPPKKEAAISKEMVAFYQHSPEAAVHLSIVTRHQAMSPPFARCTTIAAFSLVDYRFPK
jgi:hypothetical protein